jgi:putative ABC transport system permease protein
MIKNYLKIAIAVLKRRKFFTFISLFGISLTLTTVLLAAALFNSLTDPGYPDTHRDRMLYVSSLYKWKADGSNFNGASVSYYFIHHYVSTLKTPEVIALASRGTQTNAYVNDRKLEITLRYTDDHFWEALQYQFLEGKPYNRQQIDNSEQVAVIAEETRNDYFGKDVPALGKYIEADNVRYKVIGVVRNDASTNLFSYADIYLPYSLSKESLDGQDIEGQYSAFLLAPTRADIPKVQKEFLDMFARIPVADPKNYDGQSTYPDTFLGSFTRHIFGKERGSANDQKSDGLTWFYLAVVLLTFLFMLLPTLNLININITRIMERSSEIGVRKSFGASSGTLVVQFIVENVFLTVIGGLIGLLLTVVILALLNHARIIPHLHLALNIPALLYSLGACLFFGFLSGVYPAWRMSRLNVVTALKS